MRRTFKLNWKAIRRAQKTTDTYFFLTIFQRPLNLVCIILSNYFKCKLHPCQKRFLNPNYYHQLCILHRFYITIRFFAQPSWCYLLWFSSDFDLVPHTSLLNKLSAYGLSDGYLSWLHSCITSCNSFVRIHGIYSTPFEVFLVFSKDLLLGPYCWMTSAILLNILDNLLLVNDIKIISTVSSATVCILLKSNINHIRS